MFTLNKKNSPQVEGKKMEWKATKVHMHAKCFSTSFPAWEDLLKFDTTPWKSYHWSNYGASTKAEM